MTAPRPARRRSRRASADDDLFDDRGHDRRDDDYDDDYEDRGGRGRSRSSRDDRDDRDYDDEEPRSSRGSRSRGSSRTGSRGLASSSRRSNHNDDFDREDGASSRTLDAIDALDDFNMPPTPRRGSRPMTSLLFQEPVLPSVGNHDDHDDRDDEDEDMPVPGSRSRRRSRGSSADERDERDDNRNDSRRKSNRRLNAEERRAAAEVEQIEEDLLLDDITYSPIDDRDADRADRDRNADDNDRNEDNVRTRTRHRRRGAVAAREAADRADHSENGTRGREDKEREEEEEEASQTRTRRRRRRGKSSESDESSNENGGSRNDNGKENGNGRRNSGKNGNGNGSDNENGADDDNEAGHNHDEDGTVTRRRRRRRGKGGSDDEEQQTTRRSRKQQYIDEITDVEGSTRLEAKKQRRRDNRRERSRQNQLLEQDFLARREKVDRLMVVREQGRHTQISVIEDNILVEHYVSDIQEVATVGNIYLGRVQNVLPSMEAAFVDIGQARNGVLYAGEVNWDSTRLEGQPRRIELAFRSGDPVLVQVTKDPIGHKGARLTSQVTLAGRFLVLVPSGGMTGVSRKLSDRERSRLKTIVGKIAPKDMGVIIRTAAEGASEEAITKDLENLVRQWERIEAKREEFKNGKRPKLLQGEPDVAIRVVRDIFNDDFRKLIVEGDGVYGRIEEYLDTMAPDLRDKLEKWDPAEHDGKDVFDRWQIDSQLRKGMERQVYLPSGGSIVIDRTEAMTTIDVNTGRFIGKGRSLEETVTRCNLEASEEIARQLRLRDIGGMVMIDYVDMVMPANRDLVLRRLVECLARDRTKHQVAEVTSLGLVQMTRKRIGQGLVEAFSEECPACKGRGFIVHDKPTVSADFDDPYALKGGDPFIKTNKHGHGTEIHAPQGSSAAVKAKLAQIAAAAVAANEAAEEAEEAAEADAAAVADAASVAGTAGASADQQE
nr:Rne/Rng family ribonuclease [Bifidobacterium choloepi]